MNKKLKKIIIVLSGLLITLLILILIFYSEIKTKLFSRINKYHAVERIANKDGMVQVYIPAGEFLMGSTQADIDDIKKNNKTYSLDDFSNEIPQHKVYLDAYWIDKYEVTNSMFSKFIAETGYITDAEKYDGGIVLDQNTREWKMVKGADWRHPRGPNTGIEGMDNYPVVHISYNDAIEYCKWAGRRLPTEAEWEKAARGTDGRIYPWGNQEPSGNLLNFADKTSYSLSSDIDQNDKYQYISPVGSFPQGASPYGVMDMAGNVWEKVSDIYSEKYYSNSPYKNPVGPVTGENIIMKGGSWSRPKMYVRSALRYRYIKQNRSSGIGFRCASSSTSPLSNGIETIDQLSDDNIENFMIDAEIKDFDKVHEMISGRKGEYLIFGNIKPKENNQNILEEFKHLIGRWEGFSFAPPVKKDWKFVLNIYEIKENTGKAYLWAGTNLQYPDMIKNVKFKIDNNNTFSWDYDIKGIKNSFVFTYNKDKNILEGWQKTQYSDLKTGPIILNRDKKFIVYKDYPEYLAEKRIYPRWYKNKSLSQLCGQGYLLYLPENYKKESKKSYPLILFLHGSGDRGNNLYKLAKASPFMMIRNKGNLPFIIAAPILVSSEFSYEFPDEYLKNSLHEIINEYNVDKKRIYLTGLSMGGEATYRLALNEPDTFAAISPLSAYFPLSRRMDAIKNIPVWTIHGADDTIIPLSVGKKPVDTLKQIGANIKFSILKGHDHDVWTDIYSDKSFYDWLLKNKKK